MHQVYFDDNYVQFFMHVMSLYKDYDILGDKLLAKGFVI